MSEVAIQAANEQIKCRVSCETRCKDTKLILILDEKSEKNARKEISIARIYVRIGEKVRANREREASKQGKRHEVT